MLYPRFLLTFSKNNYNNTRFSNEEFLRVGQICMQVRQTVPTHKPATEQCV